MSSVFSAGRWAGLEGRKQLYSKDIGAVFHFVYLFCVCHPPWSRSYQGAGTVSVSITSSLAANTVPGQPRLSKYLLNICSINDVIFIKSVRILRKQALVGVDDRSSSLNAKTKLSTLHPGWLS